ncbi:MAG: hypothetical protein AAFQ83_08885 [Bacteroidota bacterium]
MSNPINQLISDEVYDMLMKFNLLNEKVIRDFQIKRHYLDLRSSGMRSAEAIDQVLEAYPYLQFDTVRKIIYSVKLPEELEARLACA